MAAETTTTAQAVEIAKAVLDKLTEASKAAQTTVESALPHVVKAYMYRQLGIGATFALLFIVGAIFTYIATRIGIWDDAREDPKLGLVFIIGGVACLFFGLIGTAFTLGDTIGVLGDPLGMFILGLIGK